jgi:UDP-N-acetyl-D-glucosamine dehydrogenase
MSCLRKEDEERGAKVDFYDPYVPVIPSTREHKQLAGRRSVELSADIVRSYDVTLIATDRDEIDCVLEPNDN